MSVPPRLSLFRRTNGVYYVLYERKGRRVWKSTRSTRKSDALEFLRQFREDEDAAQVSRTLLSRFSADYLAYSRTIHRPKSTDCAGTALREFLRVLGDRPIQSILVRDVEHFVGVKQRESSARTARVYLVTLASAFETAKRWGLINANPFRSAEKPRLPDRQPTFMTPTQFDLVLRSVADPNLRDLLITAVLTGLRLGEITALTWADIDLERGLILIRNTEAFTTKSKRNRVVPMTGHLARVLARRREEATCPLVFHREGKPLKKEYVSKNFKRIVRRAGLPEGLHFHSLRHTIASWLVQNGASLYEVQRLLGHSTAAMTQVYSHL